MNDAPAVRSYVSTLRALAAVALLVAYAVPLFGPPPAAPAGVSDHAALFARLFPGIPVGWLGLRLCLLTAGAVLLASAAGNSPFRHHDRASAVENDGPRRSPFGPVLATAAVLVAWMLLRLPAAWDTTRAGTASDLWQGFEAIQQYLGHSTDFTTLFAKPNGLLSNRYALLLEGLPLLRASGSDQLLPWLQGVSAFWSTVSAALCAWIAATLIGPWAAPVAAAALLCSPATLTSTVTPAPLFFAPLLTSAAGALLLLYLRTPSPSRADAAFVGFAAATGVAASAPPMLPAVALALAMGAFCATRRRRVRPLALLLGCVAFALLASPGLAELGRLPALFAERLTLAGRAATTPELLHGQAALSQAGELLRTRSAVAGDAIAGALLAPFASGRFALRPWGDVALDPFGAALAAGGFFVALRWIVSAPTALVLIAALTTSLAGAAAGALAPAAFTYAYGATVPLALLTAVGARALHDALTGAGSAAHYEAGGATAAAALALTLLIAAGGTFLFDRVTPRVLPAAATDLAAEAVAPDERARAVFIDYEDQAPVAAHSRAVLSQLGSGRILVRSPTEFEAALPQASGSEVYLWSPAVEADHAVTARLCAVAADIRLFTIVDAAGRSRLLAARFGGGSWEPSLPHGRWNAQSCDPALVAKARREGEEFGNDDAAAANDPRNANTKHARYRPRTDLRSADLVGALLAGEDMTDSDLRGAELVGARLARANLNGARLSGANLTGADLSDANLSDTDLRGATLDGASLRGASLAGAKLSDLDLRRTDIGGANLHGAKMDGVTLSGKDLTSTNMYEVTLDDAALAGAAMGGLNMRGSSLTQADLTEADMPVIDLSDSDLSKATCTRARLIGANLTGTRLNGSDLTEAKLASADLSGAKLNRAALYGAELTGALLRNSTLKKAALRGAVLRNADLSGSDLSGAILDGADLDNVAWANSTCPDGSNSDANGGTCCGHHVGRPPLSCSP